MQSNIPAQLLTLSIDQLVPGQKVSVDQYKLSVCGRSPHVQGQDCQESVMGGSIFVDHASNFIFVAHQASLNAEDTMRSKHLFEQEMACCGVIIHEYHLDNGLFTSNFIQTDISLQGQTL